jgi:drug/metabolite transporter (DMT)-like permease
MQRIMNQLPPHHLGLAMTVTGVLVLTPDALLLRLLEVGHWTTLFWRSFLAGSCLLAINWLQQRQNPLQAAASLGPGGYFCVLTFAASNACFVLSITHTAAANTLVILAAMPFIAALMTVFVLRRHLPARTWAAIFLAVAGIIIVFWGRLAADGLFGDVMALCCAFFMAGTLAAVNANPRINTISAVGFGALLSATFALFIGAAPGSPGAGDFLWLAVNGLFVVPVAMALITLGPKFISAPEVSLIMLLETVLGPLWVWLVLAEEPPGQTFIGGSVVILAVIGHAWLGFRRTPGKVPT